MDINASLITSGFSIGLFVIYKIVNHYRLKSSCNQNNELVISVVDIEQELALKGHSGINVLDMNKPVPLPIELKEVIVNRTLP